MGLTEEIGKVMEAMANDMAVVLTDVLTAIDSWYSNSNLVKQLQTRYIENGDNYVLEMFANSYIYWLDQGRKPTNEGALPSDFYIRLVDWCARRGLSTSNDVVFPIYKKIHNEGYKGKFFMEDFWDDLERKLDNDFDNVFDTICDYLSKEIFND